MVVIFQIGIAIGLNEADFLQNEPNLILFYFTKAWLETLKGPVN
jgi:hypothetical protein